jgi:hypothetical protein
LSDWLTAKTHGRAERFPLAAVPRAPPRPYRLDIGSGIGAWKPSAPVPDQSLRELPSEFREGQVGAG